MGQEAKKHCARPSGQPGLQSLDHNAEELEGRKGGARAQSAEGHAGSRLSPCWPAAEARPGSPPLLGILQPWLQPSGDPLPSNSSRALAPPAPDSTLTDTLQPVTVYTLNMDQQWDSQGTRHVIQLHGVAEGMSLLVKD